MPHYCRSKCSRSSLCVYILFTFCNLIVMILILRSIKTEGDWLPIQKFKLRDLDDPGNEGGGLLVGNILARYVFNFNHTTSRTDSKRTYVIYDSVVVGNGYESYSESSYVTLATQCSVDRLHFLPEVAESWRAPMSIAVFVPGIDFYIAKVYIAYLRLCSQIIRTNATFHMLYHRDMAPTESPLHPLRTLPPCSRGGETLPLLLRYRSGSFKRWWQQALHPQNHLRNVAVRGVLTTYHLLTDIDIMPVVHLAGDINTFLATNTARLCSRCVYVVPTYEMQEKMPVPRSKSELLERVRRKQCRPFHAKVFIHNQFATNHSLWERISDPMHLEAAYKTNYELFYEPFFVATSNVPMHDERFIGYGFTRNTQVYEMHLAGFEFWVLNPAFAVHRGMQNKRGRGTWRERQNIINRKHFIRFKHEMAAKYSKHAKGRS